MVIAKSDTVPHPTCVEQSSKHLYSKPIMSYDSRTYPKNVIVFDTFVLKCLVQSVVKADTRKSNAVLCSIFL